MEIETYTTASDFDPIMDFMKSIEKTKPKLRAKIIHEMEMLETFGRELREPSSKFIEDGIFELRANIGKDAARVFYFLDKDKAVLLNAYIKKSQKAPRTEIVKAKKYREDYVSRKRG